MKFTIGLDEIETLLNMAGGKRPKKGATFLLFACAARVFVQTSDGTAGIESLVFADGGVKLAIKTFREVLKTYKGTLFLTMEASANGMRIQNFAMPVLGYDPRPVAPAEFKMFASGSSAALLGEKGRGI